METEKGHLLSEGFCYKAIEKNSTGAGERWGFVISF